MVDGSEKSVKQTLVVKIKVTEKIDMIDRRNQSHAKKNQNHDPLKPLSPKDFGMAESRADGSVWCQDM